MTHRQELFIQEYIKTGNATHSAITAGYSKKTAYSIGQRLLKNVDIKEAIDRLSKNIAINNIMTAKERQEFLTRLILNNDVKISDKLKAVDLLNKMTGEYIQKVEVNGNVKTDDPFKNLTTEELKKIIFDNWNFFAILKIVKLTYNLEKPIISII